MAEDCRTTRFELQSRRQAFRLAVRSLRQAGVSTPELDAAVLMAHLTGGDPGEVLLNGQQTFGPEDAARFHDLILRRCRRDPVSQITGIREFYSLTFKITPDVLTPRPETEILVEEAIRIMAGMEGEPRVLDVGTGSGAIAISLAVADPRCHVVAADISLPAIRVANFNARRHSVRNRVAVLCGDLAGALAEKQTFDLIVSNPPYIGREEFHRLPPEVKRGDPREALLGGKEGLDFYGPIAQQGLPLLKSGGSLIVEVGDRQSVKVSEIMDENGYRSIRIIEDLAGAGRVVAGRKAIA